MTEIEPTMEQMVMYTSMFFWPYLGLTTKISTTEATMTSNA